MKAYDHVVKESVVESSAQRLITANNKECLVELDEERIKRFFHQ